MVLICGIGVNGQHIGLPSRGCRFESGMPLQCLSKGCSYLRGLRPPDIGCAVSGEAGVRPLLSLPVVCMYWLSIDVCDAFGEDGSSPSAIHVGATRNHFIRV